MAQRGAGATGWAAPAALVRATHAEPTAAVTLLAVVLAASSGRGPAGTAAVGAAVLAGQCSVGWSNDWVDAGRDRRAARADKPVALGVLSGRTVGTAAVLAATVCVPLSLLSGWRAGAAHIAAVALAWAYNLRLKATVWSFVPYAASFALLVAFIALGRPGHPGPPWWGLAAGALLGVGAHLANVVPDLDDDAATGVVGLPHRLGRTRSVAGAAVLLLAASGVVALGPGRPGWGLAGLVAAVVAVAVGLAALRRGRPELLFRVSLLVALIDVAMLAGRGRQL